MSLPLHPIIGGLIVSVALTTGALAQGVTPQMTGSAPDPRAGLPGSTGTHVPIADGQKRQPGGGGAQGLPDPLAGRAAQEERALEVPPNAPFMAPRDLTGAALPNNAGSATASPTGTGANTAPAPGR